MGLDLHGALLAGHLYSGDGIYVGGQFLAFDRDPIAGTQLNPNAYSFTFTHSAGVGGLLPNEALYLGIYDNNNNLVEPDAITVTKDGEIGFGTDNPQTTVQVASPQSQLFYPAQVPNSWANALGSGNLLIQSYGPRSMTAGASISFANSFFTAPGQGNYWEAGRIITTADDTNNNITGRMFLQTRTWNPTGQFWDWNSNLVLTSNGNVGIEMNAGASQAPTAPLEVNGAIKLTTGSGATITFQDQTVQMTAWNGILSSRDYAESIDVQGARSDYEPGDLIAIDPSHPGTFRRSEKAYSRLVAGVFSTKPGLLGMKSIADLPNKQLEVPMAMMGIVPTKVTDENGPITPGDLLVSSSMPGYAMRGTDAALLAGAVVGKALAPLLSGSGVISALISLQ